MKLSRLACMPRNNGAALFTVNRGTFRGELKANGARLLGLTESVCDNSF